MEEQGSWEEYAGPLNSTGVLGDALWTQTAAKGRESFKDQIQGFATAGAELAMDLGRSCWDLALQTILAEDSYLVNQARQPLAKVSEKLSFFNEFLPEDRDPLRAWLVIFVVSLLAFAVLNVTSKPEISEMKTSLQAHTAEPECVLLPDGRYMAYHELGVDARKARFTLILPHALVCPQSSGVFGINSTLLEAFGVRLISYDLRSAGQTSNPALEINLNTSAHDMLYLADFLGVEGKFWVLGYSTRALHAWAALKYIPDRVAGAIMFAPFINPYDKGMNREEKSRIWSRWPWRRRMLFLVARRFPKLLPFLYGSQGRRVKLSYSSLSKKDKDLVETRSTCQKILQWDDEGMLQACNSGFSLLDLQLQKKCPRRYSLLPWLLFLYARPECEMTGFLGPIHVWQGMDDFVVSPVVSDYVERVLPRAFIHRLPREDHFSYFLFCEECHRRILMSIFGSPKGPVLIEDKSQVTNGAADDDRDVPE